MRPLQISLIRIYNEWVIVADLHDLWIKNTVSPGIVTL